MNSIDKDCFLRKVDCEIYYCMVSKLACEQALLFGRAKLASEASLARTRERGVKERLLRRSLARSRETRFARPNRRACSQTTSKYIVLTLVQVSREWGLI